MRKTTTDLILRPKRPTDDGFIYKLSNRIFAPYSMHPIASMTSMLGEEGSLAMVAVQGAAPVGFFVLGFERLEKSFGPWRRPTLARLNAIGVEPDLHGRGVGRFLLDHAEELARAEGAVSITLMTAETNARARRLFSASGFAQLLVLQRAYARGQRGVVMTKVL
jgi:ribosomal protein S18 acetylase RimI-like enzyme